MDELEQLHAQIAELQKKAQEIAQAKRQPALDDVKAKIALYGFTAKELGFSVKASAETEAVEKVKKPVAIKYRDGENTWTGRGMTPTWLAEKIAGGAKKEDFAV